MAQYSVLKSNFQFGQISPFFGGQIQQEIYVAGCRAFCNALPDSAGGFKKRPGTIYFASPDATRKARVIEFFTGAHSYLVVITTAKIYLIDSDADSPVALCEVTSPYSDASHLDGIKVRANKGILYLVHPEHVPKMLEITSTSPWTITITDMIFTGVDFTSADNRPGALCFKGGRLFLAATNNHPTTVWASRVPGDGKDRYGDFTMWDNIYVETTDTTVLTNKKYYSKSYDSEGVAVFTEVSSPSGDPKTQGWYEWYNYNITDSHAFELEENDMYGTRILWLTVQNRVICGNTRAIFMDTGEAATPTTFDMTTSLNTGSSEVQAKTYKNYVLFLSVDRKRLYLLVWDDNSQNYTASEVTKTARGLFDSGIADFDIMDDPETIIWIVTDDGTLMSCSLDSGATGWAVHPRAFGKVRNVTVARDSHSRLFLQVETGEAGSKKYHFEYMDIPTLAAGTVFTDCSVVFNNSPASKKVEMPAVLDGQRVSAYADGGILPFVDVAEDGDNPGHYYAEYLNAVETGFVGLPIALSVTLFTPEVPANGTSIGKKKRIGQVVVRLYESFGGRIGADGAEMLDILTRRYGVYRYFDPLELVSDDVSIELHGKNTVSASVFIEHNDPVPFNVLAVGTRFELGEV